MAKKTRSVRSYQREIRKLRDMIAAVEWVKPSYNGSPSCPWCGEQQRGGHAEGCELHAVVEGR